MLKPRHLGGPLQIDEVEDRSLRARRLRQGARAALALIAGGSHARRELTPGGDLDLVLLHTGRPDVAAVADRLWYPVWDSGLRLDHSVRTVTEARKGARQEMKAALGLLSARRIAGDPLLVAALRAP